MPVRGVIAFLLVLLTAAGAVALGSAPYLPRLIAEGYPSPVWPIAGSWRAIPGAPDGPAVDRDARPIPPGSPMMQLIEESSASALVIWQGGRVRFEHYAEGFDRETRFNSYSLAKSLVGALVLKAAAEGRVADLGEPIGRYLPLYGDERFRATPIQHFLDMRSGLRLETHGEDMSTPLESKRSVARFPANPFSPLARLHTSGLEAVQRELTPSASDEFDYQNVNTAVLGALLSQIYAMPLEELLGAKIWRPAGAAESYWRATGPDGGVSAYCCIYATAWDWAKVAAYLVHNGGVGAPFLPDDLWGAFSGAGLDEEAIRHGEYSFHINHDVLDRPGEPLQGPFTYMLGQDGQTVWLLPQADMVMVRFGTRHQLLHSTPYEAWRMLGSGEGA